MLSISALAAFGLKYLFQNMASKGKITILTSIFSCLVLFEFTNIPPFHVTSVSEVPKVYRWLSQQEGDFVIAEFPIGHAGKIGDESHIELDYLFYQRIHQKKILNGAKPGTDAYAVKQKLFNITDSGVPADLKSLGVKYVVLHLRRYREGVSKNAVDIVGEVPNLSDDKELKLIKKFGDDEVYEVIASSQKSILNNE